jgi:hypothetical protein
MQCPSSFKYLRLPQLAFVTHPWVCVRRPISNISDLLKVAFWVRSCGYGPRARKSATACLSYAKAELKIGYRLAALLHVMTSHCPEGAERRSEGDSGLL